MSLYLVTVNKRSDRCYGTDDGHLHSVGTWRLGVFFGSKGQIKKYIENLDTYKKYTWGELKFELLKETKISEGPQYLVGDNHGQHLGVFKARGREEVKKQLEVNSFSEEEDLSFEELVVVSTQEK